MSIETSLFIFKKIWALITAIFWKNKNIIYLNSNKKICNLSEICSSRCVNIHNAKIIKINKVFPVKYKMFKAHFKKMQFRLYQIKRNLSENKYFAYGGFTSPMFAIFDGMQIGNIIKTELIGYDNETSSYYSIDYAHKSSNSPKAIREEKIDGDVINIVISSTYKISPEKYNSSITTFEFDEILDKKVNVDYLQRIYCFVESVLVWTQTKNIKKINLYVAAKQPVCFVIGTAIEERHPEIEIFEYCDNKYSFSLNLKTYKIKEYF